MKLSCLFCLAKPLNTPSQQTAELNKVGARENAFVCF
jgi:hypothetical protein